MLVTIERPYATSYYWLIVTDILSRTVLKLSQIVDQILDTLRFRVPFGGLGSTYTIYLRLIGKRVVAFLFVLIELFATGSPNGTHLFIMRDTKQLLALSSCLLLAVDLLGWLFILLGAHDSKS